MNNVFLKYKGLLAGTEVNFGFRFSDTANYLGRFVNSKVQIESESFVSVSDYDMGQWEALGGPLNGFGEYSLLHLPTSTFLLDYDCFIFHAVAFRWHDKAWLLTAFPGVGKSTQYRNLKELYPEEVSIINGDKPLLELRDGGTFMVHPSPWTGKEHWEGADPAPLAGIICLKQGKENNMIRASVAEVVSQIYLSIHHTFETEKTIKQAAKMASLLLKNYPVWLLTNLGNLESSTLLYNTILQWEKGNYHEV